MWTLEELLRAFGPMWLDNSTIMCWTVAHTGQLDLLKEIRELGAEWDEQTPRWAIIGGHVGCLKYAVENGCPCPRNMVDMSLMDNKANILEYLLTSPDVAGKYCVNDEAWLVWHAVAHGHTECLKLLLSASYKTRGCYECATAAEGGHLECLKMLIDASSLDSASAGDKSYVIQSAAAAGQPECLRLLYETGCCVDVTTCVAAEKGGDEECIRFSNDIFVRNWTDNLFKSVAARQIQEWWLKKMYAPNGAVYTSAKESFELQMRE